jgi:hypothetical protein
LAFYSHDLFAAVSPGRVRVDTWRNIASALLIVTGIGVAWFVLRTRHRRTAKVSLIVFFSVLSLLFAFVAQLRSMCGDEPVYIGEPSKAGRECGA